MKIQFLGAIEDVTGSMTLVENNHQKILIDSGMYQGLPHIVKRNVRPLSFDPHEIKAIILTHGHLDHSGFIPRLVKLGFRGDIFCTRETMKLARIIMTDSARILEENEHHPLHSFYAPEDIQMTASFFKTRSLGEEFEVAGLKIHFQSAGHILGAASAIINNGEKTIVFSGDVGRTNDPLMPAPEHCPSADVVVMETTYGGTIRKGDLEKELVHFLKKIKSEARVGIIASFAVARAQLLITLIAEHFKKFPEDKIRFVIDGPMMIEANKVYVEFAHDTKMPDQLKDALRFVEVLQHPREWESLQKKGGPLLILSSSGMVSGGRIWRHLENWQDDDRAALFLPGYQSEGTPGRALSMGRRDIQDEEGKKIKWRGEVVTSSAFSSHADQNELLGWIKDVPKTSLIYLNHGEIEAKEAFREKLMDMGWKHVKVPHVFTEVEV